MLKLNEYFDKQIYDRGMDYYHDKKVINFNSNGNIYHADVLGTELYSVTVSIKGNDISNMSCTCPYAKQGLNCKHMVAVCALIYEKLKLKTKNDTIIYPFSNNDNKAYEYQYFDMEKITKNLSIYKKRYQKALNLLDKNVVALDSFHSVYNAVPINQNQFAEVIGSINLGNNKYELYLILNKGGVEKFVCGHPNCTEKYLLNDTPCPHLIALLILADKHIKKYNPGDDTDSNTFNFLNTFYFNDRQFINDSIIQKKYIKLEPRISKNMQSGYDLSFKIGFKKMFVLKNIQELVEAVNTNGVFKLGKNDKIDFSIDEFDKNSQPYFDLMEMSRNYKDQDINYADDRYYYWYDANDRNLKLTGSVLDYFFDIVNKKIIPYKNIYNKNSQIAELSFNEVTPKIKLKILERIDSDNNFIGLNVSGKIPKLILGNKYQYFIDKSGFNRIDKKFSKEIQLLSNFADNGKLSLNIGRKEVSEFEHYLLPKLKQFVTIAKTQNSYTDKLIPKETLFEFFLDAKDGVPMCDAKVKYNGQEYSLFDKFIGDPIISDFRDFRRENQVIEIIDKYFSAHDEKNKIFVCQDEEEAVINVMTDGLEALSKFGQINSTSRFDAIKAPKKLKISVGVSVESDILNLKISNSELSPTELLDVLNSFKIKKNYHKLKSGEYVNLDECIEELNLLFETLKISPKEFVKDKIHIPAYRAIYIDKLLDENHNLSTTRDKCFKKIVKDFNEIKKSDYKPPKNLQPILRKYQKFGFKWLKTLQKFGFGGILADDMGLGKTLQVISIIYDGKLNNIQTPSLIVSPTSLVYNWCEEFTKFAPELKVTSVVGKASDRAKIIDSYKDFDVLITSYDLLKRDILLYDGKQFNYHVLDEAQYIKNYSTSSAKSAKLIKSKIKLALSGTPIENRLSELWSIFDFLMPGFLYSYDSFKKNYELPIIRQNDEKIRKNLKNIVSPFILRRVKSEVLKDLPEKIEKIYYANFDKQQQNVYDGQVVKIQKQLHSMASNKDFNSNKLKILAELTKIRQICCDPKLIFEDYTGPSAKKDVCMELVKMSIENGSKILLFSQFTSMFDILQKEFNNIGINYYQITGKTDTKTRIELVNRFNIDDTPLFLISLKAGGTGLNLTGADVVIHYDPWWNFAAQNQATDRAHRIGQQKSVSVYKIIAKNTIEEKILKLQTTKLDLANSILNSENSNIINMSKNDLLNLFNN